jgi:hypothetical protein
MGGVLAVTFPSMRLTLFTMFVLAGCSDAQPCRTCPPIDGVYAVTWGDPVAMGDSGVVVGDAGTCSAMGPRVPTWTIQQSDTRVTTTIGTVAMGGTLYDTFDLVLSGSESSLSYRLRALTIPEGNSSDAGIQLRGTFTTRTLPANGEPCEVNETFTAQRTSR